MYVGHRLLLVHHDSSFRIYYLSMILYNISSTSTARPSNHTHELRSVFEISNGVCGMCMGACTSDRRCLQKCFYYLANGMSFVRTRLITKDSLNNLHWRISEDTWWKLAVFVRNVRLWETQLKVFRTISFKSTNSIWLTIQ